ncbi:hypothetical protein A6R68_16677 [Neotoma lepida]|uniref:Solute carrier family 43 member 3 n=1 Tax=Neotoma lepida TaxID=56216 RepID=A0A1A6HF55_NEOLE|nr:hypothetical protein A6R68_16677 [Neotoma lepida]
MASRRLPLYLATLLTGLLECIGFAGVLFGWTSLVYVFKEQCYFVELSEQDCGLRSNATGPPGSKAQDEKFSLIFTLASFMNNFMAFPTGYIFDRFKTTVARLIGIFFYTCATLIIAFTTADSAVLLFLAMPMLTVGGMLFLITNLQVAWHVGRTFLLMPRGHIPYPLPPNYSYGFGTRKEEKKAAEPETKELQSKEFLSAEEENSEPGQQQQQGQKEPCSFQSSVLSRRFILHVVWLSTIQLWHYFFIGSLNSLLTSLAGHDPVQVSAFTNAFAITQFFGVLCAPWNGLLMDCLKQKYQKEAKKTGSSSSAATLCSTVPSLALTSLLCLGFALCASIPVIQLQYVTFILQVISRSFLYGCNAAFLTLAFPSEHFGKLFGLAMALSAIVSLLQFPLFKLSPQNIAVYVSMGLAIFLTVAHPFLVYRECRAEKTKSSVTP